MTRTGNRLLSTGLADFNTLIFPLVFLFFRVVAQTPESAFQPPENLRFYTTLLLIAIQTVRFVNTIRCKSQRTQYQSHASSFALIFSTSALINLFTLKLAIYTPATLIFKIRAVARTPLFCKTHRE